MNASRVFFASQRTFFLKDHVQGGFQFCAGTTQIINHFFSPVKVLATSFLK